MLAGFTWRSGLLLVIIVVVIAAALVAEPIAQDPAYHRFVDQRTALWIPNFLNVLSNLPFAVVGLYGLLVASRRQTTIEYAAKPAWLVFFFGIFLTALGSGYYHLDPTNETLIWDRLPMTIAFMSFVAIMIGEYLSMRAGRAILLPLLIVGAASVFYWGHTETLGRGDLRPYAVVQFLPVILIPVIAVLHRGRSDLGRYVTWMIAFYFAAKVLEFNDAEIFALGQVASGHTLKHVAAAMAAASLLYGLLRRGYHAPRPPNSME